MQKKERLDWTAADPQHPVAEQDVADRWKRSVRTLQRWRAEGYGPAYIRIGGCIFYRVNDVLAFEERMRVIPRGCQ